MLEELPERFELEFDDQLLDELDERLLEEFDERLELELLDEFDDELPTNTSCASSPCAMAGVDIGAGPCASTRPTRAAGSLVAAAAEPAAVSRAAIMPPAKSAYFLIGGLPLPGHAPEHAHHVAAALTPDGHEASGKRQVLLSVLGGVENGLDA